MSVEPIHGAPGPRRPTPGGQDNRTYVGILSLALIIFLVLLYFTMCANPGSSGGGEGGGITSGDGGNEEGGDMGTNAGGDGKGGNEGGGTGPTGTENPPPIQPSGGGTLVINIPVEPNVGASGSSPAGGIGQTGAGSSGGPPMFMGLEGKGTNHVFIVDRSGSMGSRGIKKTRLRGAQDHMIKFISGMRADAAFSVLFYGSRLEKLPPADTLIPANATNRNMAISWINSKRTQGGTIPMPALEAAIKMKPDTIWFLADAQFPRHPDILSYVKKHKGNIRINCYAIDSYSGSIMDQIAKETGGRARRVSSRDPNF